MCNIAYRSNRSSHASRLTQHIRNGQSFTHVDIPFMTGPIKYFPRIPRFYNYALTMLQPYETLRSSWQCLHCDHKLRNRHAELWYR